MYDNYHNGAAYDRLHVDETLEDSISHAQNNEESPRENGTSWRGIKLVDGELVIPEYVNRKPFVVVRKNEFDSCFSELRRLSLPQTVSEIEASEIIRLSDMLLEAIAVDSNNRYYKSLDGVLFDRLDNVLLCYPSHKIDAEYDVPEGVKALGRRSFSCVTRLQTVRFPSSLTTLAEYTFFYCDSLEYATIPNGVKEIPFGAFSNCGNLKGVKIPASVDLIDVAAFRFCPNLREIHVDEQNARYAGAADVLFDRSTKRLVRYAKNATSDQTQDDRYPGFEIFDAKAVVDYELANRGSVAPEILDLLKDYFPDEFRQLAKPMVESKTFDAELHEIEIADLQSRWDSWVEQTFGNDLEALKSAIGSKSLCYQMCFDELKLEEIDKLDNRDSRMFPFQSCKSLQSIKIGELPDGAAPSSSEKAIPTPDAPVSKEEPSKVEQQNNGGIPDGVQKVEYSEFAGNVVVHHNLNISDGTKTLDESVLEGDVENVYSVHIPASVETINVQALVRLPALESITVDEENPRYASKDGVLFDKSMETLLVFPRRKNPSDYKAPSSLKMVAPLTALILGGLMGAGVAFLHVLGSRIIKGTFKA